MSRIAPKSRTAGQPRRVTANWVFEQRSGPGRNVERSAFRKSHCAAGTKMTSRLEMTDIRKHKVSLRNDLSRNCIHFILSQIAQ